MEIVEMEIIYVILHFVWYKAAIRVLYNVMRSQKSDWNQTCDIFIFLFDWSTFLEKYIWNLTWIGSVVPKLWILLQYYFVMTLLPNPYKIVKIKNFWLTIHTPFLFNLCSLLFIIIVSISWYLDRLLCLSLSHFFIQLLYLRKMWFTKSSRYSNIPPSWKTTHPWSLYVLPPLLYFKSPLNSFSVRGIYIFHLEMYFQDQGAYNKSIMILKMSGIKKCIRLQVLFFFFFFLKKRSDETLQVSLWICKKKV